MVGGGDRAVCRLAAELQRLCRGDTDDGGDVPSTNWTETPAVRASLTAHDTTTA